MLKWLRTRNTRTATAESLYLAIVSASRRPVFYAELDVSDDVAGHFEMMTLHAFVLLERLKLAGEPGDLLGQRILEFFFRGLDHEMREMGIGDVTVPKKMNKAAEAVYGRLKAYAAAVRAEDPALLKDALVRNVYDGEPNPIVVKRLAAFTTAALRQLLAIPDVEVLAGDIQFADVPDWIREGTE